ncbi:CFEM domain-containing protein [Aspergillus candidus]|uniref:Uncharacterized protein n=1 Tax=Aspergillus candidus TaxID=41067 RepID=A0A2I2F5Q8_ASPCN|nr:hypothetical protein BDW47DRAFT_133215 [Aspergillus candidus]PLB35982.1 hypothetical protein BDW47DRAFT_133215 [Aspergillus candidus]
MRAHCFIFSLLSLLVVRVHGAPSDAPTFPSCAIACDNDLSSDCSLSNATSCFCASSSRPKALLDCVEMNCTPKQLFTTVRVYEKECGITPRKGPPVVNGEALATLILASFFFVSRIIAKSMGLAGGWGWDDYTIIASYILGVAIYVLHLYLIRHGFGQNIWDLPFPTITQFYQYFQAEAVIYKAQISLAKISVCLFLLRIFQSRTFRYLTYALIGINSAVGITWALVDALRCWPAHLTYTGWTKEEPGYCINFEAAVLVNCLVNIIVDFVIIVVPVSEVLQLQLPRLKKLSVALMFLMGSVLWIIAVIRAVVFWNHRAGSNETLGLYPLMHWSVLETQIALMCACLPAFRALISQWFPALLGNTTHRTYASGTAGQYNKMPPGSDNISKSVTYTVNYESRSVTNSDVELVGVGSTRP